ncbi:hypothetical protein RBA18_22780, partial [Mycobacteroides abscessus subsp. massiliense]
EPGRAAIVGITTEVLTSKSTGQRATMAISWRAIWRQIKSDIDRVGHADMPPDPPRNAREPAGDVPAEPPTSDV